MSPESAAIGIIGIIIFSILSLVGIEAMDDFLSKYKDKL